MLQPELLPTGLQLFEERVTNAQVNERLTLLKSHGIFVHGLAVERGGYVLSYRAEAPVKDLQTEANSKF